MHLNNIFHAAMGSFVLLLFLFFIIMLAFWIAVPFIIFSIKGLLRELFAEQKKTNEILIKILQDKSEVKRQDSEEKSKPSEF